MSAGTAALESIYLLSSNHEALLRQGAIDSGANKRAGV